MSQVNQKAPRAIILLLIIGAIAVLLAFWLLDHPLAISGSGIVIAVCMGVFFGSYTWALLWYLLWRDKARARMVSPAQATPALPRPDLEGTVEGMIPGRRYRIAQSFTDYYGNSFERGQVLVFQERHFLPYHGGHTIVFDERSCYLQEDQDEELLEHFSEYIAEIK